jgi:hypothetical protein
VTCRKTELAFVFLAAVASAAVISIFDFIVGGSLACLSERGEAQKELSLNASSAIYLNEIGDPAVLQEFKMADFSFAAFQMEQPHHSSITSIGISSGLTLRLRITVPVQQW